MHVESVLLETRDPGGEPFLFFFDSVGDHCLSLTHSLSLRGSLRCVLTGFCARPGRLIFGSERSGAIGVYVAHGRWIGTINLDIRKNAKY